MVDGVLEFTDADERIHSLPEEVGRIEVHTQCLATDLPESPERLRVIAEKARVQFDGNPDVVVGCELAGFRPIRCCHFLPLPVQDLQEVRRPGAGHPVRVSGVRRVAGAPRKGDHVLHADLVGEPDRLPEGLIVSAGRLLVRMERVSMARQCADLQTPAGDEVHESLLPVTVVDQFIDIAVTVSRCASCPDLDRFDTRLLDVIEGFLEGTVGEEHGKHTDFHGESFPVGSNIPAMAA